MRKVHKILKPGGVSVTSTVCMENKMKYLKFIAPIGRFFGLLPLFDIFTTKELSHSLTHTGFEIDHHWQSKKNSSVFIVAKKVG
jgi:hypothetical protein